LSFFEIISNQSLRSRTERRRCNQSRPIRTKWSI